MKSIKLTLHNTEELYQHPIGFKLLDPDGIILYYPHGTTTMPLKDVEMKIEVIT